MINKIYNLINNKFSIFFKFVFFIRYLFLIFFISIALFLTLPNFFDYKKNEEIIKKELSKNYSLEVKNIGEIKFKSFPVPNLEIINIDGKFFSDKINLNSKKLIIYPKLTGIYNFENFEILEINLLDNEIISDFENINVLTKNILKLDKKFKISGLNINIQDIDQRIISLKNVNLSNYGHKKNIIDGEVFNRKFKINIHDEIKNIDFRLVDTGFTVKINNLKRNEDYNFSGNTKVRILNSSIKFDFTLNENFIKINDLFFRNKKLSFDSDGTIFFKPFFKINNNFLIKDFDKKLKNEFNLNDIFKKREIIKKINSNNYFEFQDNKFIKKLIQNLKINSKLAYGRLSIKKNFFIDQSEFECDVNTDLLEDFPVLQFDCLINSPDKRKLLKKIQINTKKKNEQLSLILKGNLNILNNKVNFDLIKMNDNYKASNEDLKFFKEKFENILFDKDFISIFDLYKIKKFIIEIS